MNKGRGGYVCFFFFKVSVIENTTLQIIFFIIPSQPRFFFNVVKSYKERGAKYDLPLGNPRISKYTIHKCRR